ncbi:hypothetical protein IPM65_00360 [Candidatus Roizmanbacteria bacterium]|nr:MAG: hypothetical protein IPM65_00360 [Candidatus Roizmanbacteria bacterium]
MSQVTVEQKSPKRKYLWLILLLLLFLIGIVVIFIFPKSKSETTSDKKSEKQQTVMHGTYQFKSGIGAESTGEFWFDGDKYRITWYNEDGTPRLHMISPDGKQMYHAQVDNESSKISYMPPAMHHAIFLTPKEYLSKEVSKEEGYDVTMYDLDKLWDIENAEQQFYLKDVKHYVQDGKLAKIVARTSSRKPDDEADLVTSTYTITSLDTEPTDQSLFTLPYPVSTENEQDN